MSILEDVIARGNRYYGPDKETGSGARRSRTTRNKIKCADGFTLSVIAGAGTYCKPRPALIDFGEIPNFMYDEPSDFCGPYTHVEVGFPSERPEPWAGRWETYCEDPNSPTDTVYGYVPVEMVRALIEAHGGES